MQLANLRRPLQAAAINSCRPNVTVSTSSWLSEKLARLRLDVGINSTSIAGQRWASVKSQGAYKIPNKKTIPKKLGAKRTGDQYVIPGNILYKQRGTIWHAGENAILGRDHTIHAAVAGYVKYYRDPARHPTHQYIGVAFNREDKLPYPANEPRRRRLGMVAVPRKTEDAPPEVLSPSGIPIKVVRRGETLLAGCEDSAVSRSVGSAGSSGQQASESLAQLMDGKRKQQLSAKQRRAQMAQLRMAQRKLQKETRVLHLQEDYSYREHNREIGRLVGPAGRVQGAGKMSSRKAILRTRRRRKQSEFGTLKAEARRRRVRRLEQDRHTAEKRALKAAEAENIAAENAKAKAARREAERREAKSPTGKTLA